MPNTSEFKKLLKNVKKRYLGKRVPIQYKKKYGYTYDIDELNSLSYAIAKSKRMKLDIKK